EPRAAPPPQNLAAGTARRPGPRAPLPRRALRPRLRPGRPAPGPGPVPRPLRRDFKPPQLVGEGTTPARALLLPPRLFVLVLGLCREPFPSAQPGGGPGGMQNRKARGLAAVLAAVLIVAAGVGLRSLRPGSLMIGNFALSYLPSRRVGYWEGR